MAYDPELDPRYAVMYVRYWGCYHHSLHSTLADALFEAISLNYDLSDGDRGISFIVDRELPRRSDIGNGSIRESMPYWKEIDSIEHSKYLTIIPNG